MNAMNAINAMTKKQNNATTCNQPNDATKVTPAHYEELEELQLESVAAGVAAGEKKRIKLIDGDMKIGMNKKPTKPTKEELCMYDFLWIRNLLGEELEGTFWRL